MEKIKEALRQLPHVKKIWVSKDDENIFYYRPKPGFVEMSREDISLNEEGVLEEKKSKNKK
jgi:hypothetical protein